MRMHPLARIGASLMFFAMTGLMAFFALSGEYFVAFLAGCMALLYIVVQIRP